MIDENKLSKNDANKILVTYTRVTKKVKHAV